MRAYLFAGTQHSPGQFPPRKSAAQQQADNPVQYWWTMRALLVAMTHGSTSGTLPPPSQHPQFKAEGSTIVKASDVAFPAIPGVQSPRIVIPGPRWRPRAAAARAARSTPTATSGPASACRTCRCRSPPTRAGTSGARRSAAQELVALAGSSIPFAATKAKRTASGDPRLSVEERYTSKDDYLRRVREAADKLVKERYLLADDVNAIVAHAGAMWDHVVGSR